MERQEGKSANVNWELLGRGRGQEQNPQRAFLVYSHMIIKRLLTLISSLAGTGISVLMSNHGEEDNPSNNKIIMIIKRAIIILMEL